MPKGVEHADSTRYNAIIELVRLSLMPKGVEHSLDCHRSRCSWVVRLSLMPKGVEHFRTLFSPASWTASCDSL